MDVIQFYIAVASDVTSCIDTLHECFQMLAHVWLITLCSTTELNKTPAVGVILGYNPNVYACRKLFYIS